MIKTALLNILFLVLVSEILYAQDKRGQTTIYGGGGVFAAFNTNGSLPVTGQLFPTPANLSEQVLIAAAHSCISDSANGNLLFFTNSVVAFDISGHVIENGDSLQPKKVYEQNCCPADGFGLTQGSLILPKGSNNQYYVFTPTCSDNQYNYWITNPLGDGRFPYDILQYHVIDMNANSGLGKVIQKNVKLLEHVELNKTGMMACKHANGYDWWLLKQGANTNTVYTFLVTKDTITLDTIQTFPEPIFGYYDLAGQSCFSNDGSKYAFASGGGYLNNHGAQLYIADFDRCYGTLSNIKKVNVPYDSTLTILDTLWGAYDSLITGISFSPNDSFLYVNRRYLIYQYELNQTDSILAWYKVKQGMDTTFQQFAEYGQLQLGLDGRLYIGKRGGTTNSNSVINFPNLKGMNCEFCRKCLRMDTTQWYTHSLTNMPNFNMPPKTPCWPLQNEHVKQKENEWTVYPNPAAQTITITNATGKLKVLYDALGQVVLSTTKNEIDISRLRKGLYYLRCEHTSKKVLIE